MHTCHFSYNLVAGIVSTIKVNKKFKESSARSLTEFGIHWNLVIFFLGIFNFVLVSITLVLKLWFMYWLPTDYKNVNSSADS